MADPTKAYLGYHPEAELVFGIVCPLGTNYHQCVDTLSNVLSHFRYEANIIRLSDFFTDLLVKLKADLTPAGDEATEKARFKIQAGNEIRRISGQNDALALTAAGKIYDRRPKKIECTPDGQTREEPEPLPKTAHVIATLKRPEEVDCLRRIYGLGFFLIGISATEEDREGYLRETGIIEDQTRRKLIQDDAEESLPYGQATQRTFYLADVFISMRAYREQISRFLDLLFGCPKITPTREEHDMFLAYAASLSSGDLSRQVGAAIVDGRGDLLSVGFNDVPKFRGGLYGPGTGSQRDMDRGYDSNDREKLAIAQRIATAFGLRTPVGAEELRTRLGPTGFFDITEFGRSVHAEMEAILACARTGRRARGATVYTTTFPCHNCTRHIIAAGIQRVFYIEPYPKSKAGPLHSDAISIDEEEKGKIPFLPFIGVGPRRYFDLFSLKLSTGQPMERKREEDGRLVGWERTTATVRLQLQPTSYLQREALASRELLKLSSLREGPDGRGT